MATIHLVPRLLSLPLRLGCLTLASLMLLALEGCQQAGPTSQIGTTVTSPAATATPFGGSGLIAYLSDQHLFVRGTDGSAPVQLTPEQWSVEDFLWSPDGTRLAFKAWVCDPEVADCMQDVQMIYTIQPDGSGLLPVAASDGYELSYMAWSPDGKEIAFSSYVFPDDSGQDFYAISLVSASGGESEPRRLIRSDQHDLVLIDWVAWSPDGTQIAFDSNLENFEDQNIYLLDVRTVALTRLTDEAGRDQRPAWSPDGSRIAFFSDRAGGSGVFLMSPDGSDLVQVAAHADIQTPPAWSPDGSQIAYTADRNRDIYLARVDGSEPMRLTDTPEREWYPAWSPDGQWILFVGDDLSIYAQSVSGPQRRTLADALALDVWALWQP